MPKWDAEVNQAASHWSGVYGFAVDPALVHAIIERESAHGAAPNYVVHGGVVPEPGGHYSGGPMQVYDLTLRTLNPTLDLAALAEDPAVGIWYGTHWLAHLLSLYPGNAERAISAYNTGTGHAVRDASGRWPNQSYVDAVVGFWNRYRGGVTAMLVPMLALVAGAVWFANSRRRQAA